MKKNILFSIILISITLFGCQKDNPLPYYEVVPVIEINNAFFDEVYSIRLNNTLTVDGVPTTSSWDIDFKGVRYGCNTLKWIGEPVEYQAPTKLEFEVQVLYDVTGSGGGVPIENFSGGYLPREATWIRVYFEVRDRNNPSDRFVGIEQYNNPANGEYQAPKVSWTVSTDFNFVPTNNASPQSNLRMAKLEECPDCNWTRIK